MKNPPNAVNLPRGLSLLMKPGNVNLAHIDHCSKFTNRWFSHPFGLDLPERGAGMWSIKINFVGTYATETTVDVFLAHVRFWAGYADGCKATKLRVISAPFASGQKGQNYVFFELWATSVVIVSGETTDFSGGGKLARQKLEDVFAVLANSYGLEIERVQLKQSLSIEDLRNLRAEQAVPA